MATFDSFLVAAQTRGTRLQVNASTASAEQAFGNNEMVAINADQDITIRFGAPGAVGTPDATDFRLPANTIWEMDMGRQWTSFKVFNLSASTTVNVYFLKLTRS